MLTFVRLATLSLAAVVLSLAPASAQPLTQQDRDALLKHLDQTRQSFLASVSGVSEPQWKFKAGPDRWSIAEVAEHIAISETTLLQLVTDRVLKSPAAPRDPNAISDAKLLEGLLDRTNKFQAPEMLKPASRWATADALTKDFVVAREKTAAYVRATADDLHGHSSPHPVFKTLDGYQWILLLSGHAARHTAQIEEVKAGPGYPKQ